MHTGSVSTDTCLKCPYANKPSFTKHELESFAVPVQARTPQETEPDLPMWDCIYRGRAVLEEGKCNTCGMKGQPFNIYQCDVHGKCSLRQYRTNDKSIHICVTCEQFEEPPVRPIKWSYGITTVIDRKDTTFPATLESLRKAGFDKPRLFLDGAEPTEYKSLGLDITCHLPNIRTWGNWALALGELYIREPQAQRYAIFQDDFIALRNLRSYLDKVPFPEKGYWNLYTFPKNQVLAPKDGTIGFYRSNQLGKGAVALVFDRTGVLDLFSSPDFLDKPQHVSKGWKNVDGNVITALRKKGYSEYVHNPSLTQHTGRHSTMRNPVHAHATSFKGEDFDAMELLPCNSETP
jgi:hypothetical protein